MSVDREPQTAQCVTLHARDVAYHSTMRIASNQDRRRQPRFASDALQAEVRVKGQFGRVDVQVLDFNRNGLAVHIDRPLPKDQLVFLNLDHDTVCVERVIGVVHNCLAHSGGYRCGILFRTQSDLQFDKALVEANLAQLESHLATVSAESEA